MTPLGGSKRWRLAVGALGLAGEYRLEGFGFAFLALVFFLLGIAWLVGLIDDPERFVYGGVSLGAAACFLFVVVRVFKFRGPID
jgi:hypothetical protein